MLLAAALRLAALGLSVVPIEPRGKRPIVRWTELQQRRAGPEEITQWYTECPDANVGVVTGEVSGIVVADIERHGLPFLDDHDAPMCVLSETQRGGRHLFFSYDPAVRTGPLFDAGAPFGDARSDGGLVVVPPSVGSHGTYGWVVAPWERPLAEAPRWLSDPTLRRGATAVWGARPAGCGSSDERGSRSEADMRDVVRMLIEGTDPARIADLIASRPTHADRGRWGDAYVARSIERGEEWVRLHCLDLTIRAVRSAGQRLRIEFLSDEGEPFVMMLDHPPTVRSGGRWRALSAAVGFDAVQSPADLQGKRVRVEILGEHRRLGRVGPGR